MGIWKSARLVTRAALQAAGKLQPISQITRIGEGKGPKLGIMLSEICAICGSSQDWA